MVEDPYVLRADDAGISTLTLNRPHSRNSLSLPMLKALNAVLADVAADEAVRVVVLAGAGPAFSAGHDLKEMRAEGFGRAYADELFGACADAMIAIARMAKPVIARVHGIATAAGCQLVATCDLAIAETGSRFATPGVNIGLFCSTPMVALTRAVAPKHAMQMLLTGEMIDAPTALRMGLINEIVEVAELDAAVYGLAAKLAAKSPHTIAIGKRAFHPQADMSLEQAYAFTRTVMTDNLQSEDAREGISAFIDKRSPVWRGR